MPSCRGEQRPRLRAELALRDLVAGLAAGTPLPTQRRLAEQLGQARPTIARALASLVADGVLVADGRGLAVAALPDLPATLDTSLVLVPPANAPCDDPIVRAALARIVARDWHVVAARRPSHFQLDHVKPVDQFTP